MKVRFTSISRRVCRLSVALFFTFITVGFSEPILRVGFIAEQVARFGTQPGFESMIIPERMETENSEPISQTFGEFVVTLSPQDKAPDGMLSEVPGRLLARFRGVPPGELKNPYSQLFRSWVGGNAGLSVQIKGLKPQKKYIVTFYAFDYSNGTKTGRVANIIHDALKPGEPEVRMEWECELGSASNTPTIEKHSVHIESTSSDDGRVIYTFTNKGLINGLEVEEGK